MVLHDMLARNRLRFYDIENKVESKMRKKAFDTLQRTLDEAEMMANKSKASTEEFDSLVDKLQSELAEFTQQHGDMRKLVTQQVT